MMPERLVEGLRDAERLGVGAGEGAARAKVGGRRRIISWRNLSWICGKI
jgi:hypothetical protein